MKALLKGARRVYSVFGPRDSAKASSDNLLLKVLWEVSSNDFTSLADMNNTKKICLWPIKRKTPNDLNNFKMCLYLSLGSASGLSGGWRHWSLQCPSSGPSWCRSQSDCHRHSQSLCCCLLQSHTWILPWLLLHTGHSLTSGSSPGLTRLVKVWKRLN